MRIKIFILSIVLISLVCGVYYYKNLTQLSKRVDSLKLDIDELRTIDQQISNTSFYLRQNLNSDSSDLKSEKLKITNFQKLLSTVKKSTPELQTSLAKILLHFEFKIKTLEDFENSILKLRTSVNALLPIYDELEKKNIKFILEKRDFYRECLLDIYMYISFPYKDNEMRVSEDLKVLNQIINFATSPSPEVQKFASHMEIIQTSIKEINNSLTMLKEDSIQSEVKIISRYYQDSIEDYNLKNENILTFMMIALGIYLVFMILVLIKK